MVVSVGAVSPSISYQHASAVDMVIYIYDIYISKYTSLYMHIQGENEMRANSYEKLYCKRIMLPHISK